MHDKARIILLSRACANLVLARNALQEAQVALLNAVVDPDDDPIWELANELKKTSLTINSFWKKSSDLVWKA